MGINLENFSIYLSPEKRGAPDRLRTQIEDLLRRPGSLLVASQQICDRPTVDVAIRSLEASGLSGRFLLEGQYLRERSGLPQSEVWAAGGKFETHRQCFSALLRAGAHVRADHVGSALQHANFIVSKSGRDHSDIALLTSANLAPGSVNTHYNWLVTTEHPEIVDALSKVFDRAWDGDFRDVAVSTNASNGTGSVEFAAGAAGQALDLLTRAIEQSKESIDFAFFNISKSSPVVEALIEAQTRGVDISGVVDGDQGGQSWDAVPTLQSAGIDAKYYPAALSGGVGRMHYKFAAIDEQTAYLGTANISASAEKSLELALLLEGGDKTVNTLLRTEVLRLQPLARKTPPANIPL